MFKIYVSVIEYYQLWVNSLKINNKLFKKTANGPLSLSTGIFIKLYTLFTYFSLVWTKLSFRMNLQEIFSFGVCDIWNHFIIVKCCEYKFHQAKRYNVKQNLRIILNLFQTHHRPTIIFQQRTRLKLAFTIFRD